MSDQVEALARRLSAAVDGPHGPLGDAGQRLAHYRRVAEVVIGEAVGEDNWCTCRCEGCRHSGHCAVNYTGCGAT